MCESSGSQFSITTPGIQSVEGALEESRSVMTFLKSLRDQKYYAVSIQISSRK